MVFCQGETMNRLTHFLALAGLCLLSSLSFARTEYHIVPLFKVPQQGGDLPIVGAKAGSYGLEFYINRKDIVAGRYMDTDASTKANKPIWVYFVWNTKSGFKLIAPPTTVSMHAVYLTPNGRVFTDGWVPVGRDQSSNNFYEWTAATGWHLVWSAGKDQSESVHGVNSFGTAMVLNQGPGLQWYLLDSSGKQMSFTPPNSGSASFVSDSGTVFGVTWEKKQRHNFVGAHPWASNALTGTTVMPTIPGTVGAYPVAYSNNGLVVGHVSLTEANPATGMFVWDGLAVQYFPPEMLLAHSVPWGLNDTGQIVGEFGSLLPRRGFLKNPGKDPLDFNNLLAIEDKGKGVVTTVRGISDDGTVVGTITDGLLTTSTIAFVGIPVEVED